MIEAAEGSQAPAVARDETERRRKRRRRRRGQRLDEAAAATVAASPAPVEQATRHAHAETFLARLKSRLKTIINRLPGRGRSR